MRWVFDIIEISLLLYIALTVRNFDSNLRIVGETITKLLGLIAPRKPPDTGSP